MQARTDGDGAPPLRSAIPYHIAADWEEFADIRAAARALSQKSRLRNALSIAVNSVRVALAAAALCADRSASPATVLSREDELHRLDTIGRFGCTRTPMRYLWTVRDLWPRTGFFLRRKCRLSW